MDKPIGTTVEINDQPVESLTPLQRLGMWMMHRGAHLLAGPQPKPKIVQVWTGQRRKP